MADNDVFRILVGGTASNSGYAEIATADDGTEPIYVRQYSGVFTSLVRTATLLDEATNLATANKINPNILEYANKNETPITVIGNGSNLLVKDGGIRGIVLRIDIQDFNIEKISDEYIITVGAGVKNGFVAQKLLIEEIEGFEFAAGIPGSIGGAIRMNAGAHGGEMKNIVLETKCIDKKGNIKILSNEEQKFEYLQLSSTSNI